LILDHTTAVPIFNVDKRPFALLCAYNAEGPTKRFLEGHELSYLRAIGVIILSAVLKRRMTLADKAKSLFISNISHELRTPLHGILAAAELLSESDMSHVQASFLETIQACGTSLVETVNHVLDFTKLSGNTKAGGVENSITPTEVDLLHLVEDAVDGCFVGFRARTTETGIGSVYSPPRDVGIAPQALVETVVDIEAPPESWCVKCEKSGIRRVLMNLFSNSLKFTTNGYVRVALRQLPRSSEAPRDEVLIELSVSDTGKGISQDFIRNQLFHPFSQENPLQTGTGLGLAIVNSIVQSDTVRGKVDVWSEEGVGTEIKITFSAKLVKSDELPWLHTPFNSGPGSAPTVSMVGFNSSHSGISLLHDVIENYLVNWFGLRLVPEDAPLGQIVFLNNDYSPVVNAISQRDTQHPFVIFSDVRGDPAAMSIASDYDNIGGFCRILYKPAGPSRLRSVIKLCLHALNIYGNASLEDLSAHQHNRNETNVLHHLSRRKSEEVHPTRPSLLPRSITVHPLSNPRQNLPSTFESDESPHEAPLSAPLPSIDSPVDEMPLTVPVGTGGTLLQSSVSERIKQSSQFRVLVVEDNAILRDLLGKWLTKKGYDYSVAVDGEDGVQTFESQGPFDIVLLDLSMPVLDGVGATLKIRQRELQLDYDHHSNHRPTRILALTGMSTIEDKRRAFEAGVDGYLVKPVAFKTLDEIFSKLGFTS
jgi:signal transduction histidine kinase/CheY-like chemotaxis protein